MANKKINELAARTGLADNDLLAVGDPDDGTLYNVTVGEILSLLSVALDQSVEEISYTATGAEGSSVSILDLVDAVIGGVFRTTRVKKVIGTPSTGQVKFTSSTGTLQFSSDEPLVAGEVIIIDKLNL